MYSEVEDIVGRGKDLTSYISNSMHLICEENFKYIQHYFKLRGAIVAPRISLKGFWPTPGTTDSKRFITTLYSTSTNPRRPSALDESSTFSKVYETGKFKLVNDVPKETLEGTYSSSRFDAARVEKYREDPEKFPFENCFLDYGTAPASKLYKSSLVVPVSLMLNSDLSDEFRNTWKKTCKRELNSSGQQGLEGRLIFGFLCIDHVDANFFIEPSDNPSDIDVAYYFADLLSFYLFQRANLTIGSEQFHLACAILDKKESRLRVDVPTQAKEISFVTKAEIEPDASVSDSLETSKSNVAITNLINNFQNHQQRSRRRNNSRKTA